MRVFDEIAAEVVRAEKKHPNSDFLDGTRNGGMNLHQRERAQNSCDRAVREGRCTWAQVLEEEFWEAMCEEDKVKLRAELVQVAAVATRWIQKLDAEEKT
jgi:hypothetical protein